MKVGVMSTIYLIVKTVCIVNLLLLRSGQYETHRSEYNSVCRLARSTRRNVRRVLRETFKTLGISVKLTIRTIYERYEINERCHSFRDKSYEVEPVKIYRSPCGSGAASKRYTYRVLFIGFGDMVNVHNKSVDGVEVIENINRKLNPSFNPKKLKWDGNVAIL